MKILEASVLAEEENYEVEYHIAELTREIASTHYDVKRHLPDCREKSLVLTKLEEAQHWIAAIQAAE